MLFFVDIFKVLNVSKLWAFLFNIQELVVIIYDQIIP